MPREKINLDSTEITNKGIQIIINKGNSPNLKELSFFRNIITNEGLKMLSSGKWTLLESLSLTKLCCLTEEEIVNVGVFSEWINLKILDLFGNERIFSEGNGGLACGKWVGFGCHSKVVFREMANVKLVFWKEVWLKYSIACFSSLTLMCIFAKMKQNRKFWKKNQIKIESEEKNWDLKNSVLREMEKLI